MQPRRRRARPDRGVHAAHAGARGLPGAAAAPRRLRDPRPLPRPAADRAADRVRGRPRAMARVTGRGRDRRSAAEYEAALGAACTPSSAGSRRRCPGRRSKRSGSLSRNVWQRANGRSRAGRAAAHARRDPRRRGRAQPARRRAHSEPGISGEDLRRGGLAAMRRGGRGARAGRAARDLRPHPPARAAARRRRGRMDVRHGHTALEQRKLVPRARVRGAARAPRALLARHADQARGERAAAHRERARGRGAARAGASDQPVPVRRSSPPPAAAGAISAGVAPLPLPAASASARSSSASPFGGSFAHSSSNSTRHLPSSTCSRLELGAEGPAGAAAEAGDGLLGPAHARVLAALARGAQARDQLLGHRDREVLAGLLLPDHEAAAGVLARPARDSPCGSR